MNIRKTSRKVDKENFVDTTAKKSLNTRVVPQKGGGGWLRP